MHGWIPFSHWFFHCQSLRHYVLPIELYIQQDHLVNYFPITVHLVNLTFEISNATVGPVGTTLGRSFIWSRLMLVTLVIDTYDLQSSSLLLTHQILCLVSVVVVFSFFYHLVFIFPCHLASLPVDVTLQNGMRDGNGSLNG